MTDSKQVDLNGDVVPEIQYELRRSTRHVLTGPHFQVSLPATKWEAFQAAGDEETRKALVASCMKARGGGVPPKGAWTDALVGFCEEIQNRQEAAAEGSEGKVSQETLDAGAEGGE